MRHRLAVLHQIRDQVLAEVAAGVRVGGVAAQLVEQELGGEHVDAHAGQRHVRLVRHAWRILWFLEERR